MTAPPAAPSPTRSLRPSRSALRGMGWMALAALTNAGTSAVIRHVGATLHPIEAAFFTYLFAALILGAILVKRGLGSFRTPVLHLHLIRCAISSVAILSWFVGVTMMPLAELTALNFSGPLFAAVLAVFVLGERIRARRIAALLFGYLGTLVVLRPGLVDFGLGPLLILVAAAGYGCVMVILRITSRTDSSLTATLYMVFLLTPVFFFASLFVWRTPTLTELLWLAGIGLSSVIQFWSLAQAFREAEATVVLPLDFTRLLWATALGLAIWNEMPDVWTWVGGVMIFSAVLYIAFRERQAARERARAAPGR